MFLGVKGFANPVLGVIGHLAGRIGLDILAEFADREVVIAARVITVGGSEKLVGVARRDLCHGWQLGQVFDQPFQFGHLLREPFNALVGSAQLFAKRVGLVDG